MSLRKQLRDLERSTGWARIHCLRCGKRWTGQNLETDLIVAEWAQALDNEAWVEGDVESLEERVITRYPGISDVVWEILDHPHQAALVLERSGTRPNADVPKLWDALHDERGGEGWTNSEENPVV